jgi:hypothetical protein
MSLSSRLPALYRILTWCMLLLAMLGVLEYSVHAWQVWQHFSGVDAAARARLRVMLGWDAAYLVGACLTLSVAAGVLLRREWARRAMRVVALLLAAWAVWTAWRWSGADHALAQLLARPDLDAISRAQITHQRRALRMAMLLKLASAPLLAWLAWRLGRPAVRAQFRGRALPQ